MNEGLTVRRAEPLDAALLAATRQKAWAATYRGIYPDAWLEEYDLAAQTARERARLQAGQDQTWLVLDGADCVGYYSFGAPRYGAYRDYALCLNALYLLPGYQRRGLGRSILAQVRAFARAQGQKGFFCGCNLHNTAAQGFYRAMGGVVGKIDGGHENHAEDQMYFEFDAGERT